MCTAELLQETQNLLLKPIGKHYYDYVHIYEKIHGYSYTGCKCKKITLYNIIQRWYNNNTQIN